MHTVLRIQWRYCYIIITYRLDLNIFNSGTELGLSRQDTEGTNQRRDGGRLRCQEWAQHHPLHDPSHTSFSETDFTLGAAEDTKTSSQWVGRKTKGTVHGVHCWGTVNTSHCNHQHIFLLSKHCEQVKAKDKSGKILTKSRTGKN